jgi:omega-6 fatty acid desaturase (delta-12 desaturase)
MHKDPEIVKATKPFAREIRWLSWWHLWSTLALLIGLLGITCLPIFWLARLPVSILAALVLVRMFIIYHDYQHGTILQGSWLADVLMRLYGLFLLNPPSIWNCSHNYHHRHNARVPGSPIGTFPVMTTESYAQASWWQRFQYRVARNPLTLLFGYFTVFLYTMCISSFLARPRQHFDAGIAVLLQAALVVGLLLIGGPSLLLLTWLVPCMTASALGAYLFYAQHNFPGVQFQGGTRWDYVFSALKSSSYMTMSPIMHWLTGNIGYHHVHHLNSRIPFYRLPEAMAKMPSLQSPGTTSLNPVAIYRCLRLKLWDAHKNRMVGFRGT